MKPDVNSKDVWTNCIFVFLVFALQCCFCSFLPVMLPTNFEHDYAICEVHRLGKAFMGNLGDYTSSSSRIALLGTIIALFSDQPLHLAVDNASVVKRATIFRDWLLHHSEQLLSGKPFGLTKNGDPWQIFCDVLCARGHASFMIKKRKVMRFPSLST